MLKRLLVYSLLTALVNSTVGCSHIATIRTEEAKRPKYELAITKVELRPIIASLETSDKGEIRFDSVGGRFLLQDRAFVGLDSDGDSMRIDFRTVTGVKQYRDLLDRTHSTELDLSEFFKEHREFNVYGVYGVFVDTVSPRGPLIELADSSGYFYVDGRRFTGVTMNGNRININSDDVTASWTKEKRTDHLKTGLLITGTLILVGGIIAVIAISQSLQGGFFIM